MDDKRTPMEAEVQELPTRLRAGALTDSYGTAAKPRPRRTHTGIWIALGMTVILLCTASVVVALGHVRLVREDGRLHLSMERAKEPEETQNKVQNLPVTAVEGYVPAAGDRQEDVDLDLALEPGSDEALSPEQIYRQASPAVVCIQVESYYGNTFSTGVVISEDGFILTAAEDLSWAATVTVCFQDGTTCLAQLIGADQSTGVCLLKVEAQGLQTVRFSDAQTLAVGQKTYCVCNPYGSQIPNVFYEGMLSARRTLELDGYEMTVLQTSAQLQNVGWGCPILDSRAQVVGLTAPVGEWIASGTASPSLALSAADLVQIVESLERTKTETRPWLGLEVGTIPESTRTFCGYPGTLWITGVARETPPYGVLFQFDVITQVNGVPVSTLAEYESLLAAAEPGKKVCLTIFRNDTFYEAWLPVMSR